MPKIEKVYTLEITPEQFLNTCSSNELQEIIVLLNSNYFQNKINRNNNFLGNYDSNMEERELFFDQSLSTAQLSVRVLNRLVPFFYDQNITSRNWKVRDLVNFNLKEFSKLRGNGTGVIYHELLRFLQENKIPHIK